MVWEIKDGFRATVRNLRKFSTNTDDPAIKYVIGEVIRGNRPWGNTHETRTYHLKWLHEHPELTYTDEGQLGRFIRKCEVKPTLDKWGEIDHYNPALIHLSSAAGHVFEQVTNRNGIAI
jgi:hypothetical protein